MKYIATGQSRDNTLFMHQARKILLQVSLPGFGISLKSCYNYTESYKDKTYAAKRHHAGKGVNAKISLKWPPRTGVSKHVINLHWTTKNVNLLPKNMETCSNDCVIDSKDAKVIVCVRTFNLCNTQEKVGHQSRMKIIHLIRVEQMPFTQ